MENSEYLLKDALAGAGEAIGKMSDSQLRLLMGQVIEAQQQDRKENQLLYYKPVSEMAERVHLSNTRYLGVGGGNGASKTDTILAELTMLTTGIIPPTLKPEVAEAIRAKFRGPVAVRVVVESLTTTLSPIILPKLQWWKWNGTSEPGGDRGHWGWMPRRMLKNGQWQQSWSEKLRMLTHLCQDPETGKVLGESTWQFMAHNQDPSDFASGDFHHILHDELTTWPIWREDEARTMRVGGRMILSMTWPDDPSIPVDWAYDLLYEPGQPGPNKDETVDWFEMWSRDNPNLDQDSVRAQEEKWSDEVKAVRLYGRPIRFSNRIHPDFTDRDTTWCKVCKKDVMDNSDCSKCFGSSEVLIPYNHVTDFEASTQLPTIFLLDPHPRKPHMGLWVQVDTWDDIWVIDEILVDGEVEEVRDAVFEREDFWKFRIAQRIGDPNMLQSPAGIRRHISWKEEFSDVGLFLDLGDDSDVGRGRVNEYLRIDVDRGNPRIHVHPRCVNTIRQMQRYVWDDFKRTLDKDQKQLPKPKEDDFPTLLKYLMNSSPKFENLTGGPKVLRTRG